MNNSEVFKLCLPAERENCESEPVTASLASSSFDSTLNELGTVSEFTQTTSSAGQTNTALLALVVATGVDDPGADVVDGAAPVVTSVSTDVVPCTVVAVVAATVPSVAEVEPGAAVVAGAVLVP